MKLRQTDVEQAITRNWHVRFINRHQGSCWCVSKVNVVPEYLGVDTVERDDLFTYSAELSNYAVRVAFTVWILRMIITVWYRLVTYCSFVPHQARNTISKGIIEKSYEDSHRFCATHIKLLYQYDKLTAKSRIWKRCIVQDNANESLDGFETSNPKRHLYFEFHFKVIFNKNVKYLTLVIYAPTTHESSDYSKVA